MQGKHMTAELRDAEAVKQLSRAITAWDPLFSIRYSRGESLYDGVRTSYGICVGTATELSFRGHREQVGQGDAVVLLPAIRVTASPASEFFWICHEGLAPEHLRGSAGQERGFECLPLPRDADRRPGTPRDVIPASDLRYRVQYSVLEQSDLAPASPPDMLALCYALAGEGEVQVGTENEQGTALSLKAGQLLALGPGLTARLSPELTFCVCSMYDELGYRRLLRQAASR